jgi:hypothetical protein
VRHAAQLQRSGTRHLTSSRSVTFVTLLHKQLRRARHHTLLAVQQQLAVLHQAIAHKLVTAAQQAGPLGKLCCSNSSRTAVLQLLWQFSALVPCLLHLLQLCCLSTAADLDYGTCLLLAGQEDPAAAGCATAVEGRKLQQHVMYDYTLATLLLLRSIHINIPCGRRSTARGCVTAMALAACSWLQCWHAQCCLSKQTECYSCVGCSCQRVGMI